MFQQSARSKRSAIMPTLAGITIACALVASSGFWLAPLLRAQEQQGPEALPAPQFETIPDPPRTNRPQPQPSPVSAQPKTPELKRQAATPQGISKEPPSIPVDQIIQRFAQSEAEFQQERDNFTYVQTFTVQTVDDGGQPDGEYTMTSDIMFTSEGKRFEKVTYAPPSTLQRISLSQQDMDDLKNVQPFVLTTEQLPKYNVTYVGREKVDEIGTYIFDVGPKVMEKNQRYFQGRIWVDDRDLQIVKTYGKAVPDIRKGSSENVFPRFETYRENIEGHYWFPTYTHADDVLHFQSGDVRIRMTVHYSDYKRFRVAIRLLPTPQTPQ
jgi:hypothetical protein